MGEEGEKDEHEGEGGALGPGITRATYLVMYSPSGSGSTTHRSRLPPCPPVSSPGSDLLASHRSLEPPEWQLLGFMCGRKEMLP